MRRSIELPAFLNIGPSGFEVKAVAIFETTDGQEEVNLLRVLVNDEPIFLTEQQWLEVEQAIQDLIH